MVLATIRMKIPPKKHVEAWRVLKWIAEQNRVQRGCLSCQIYKDAEEDSVFMFEEMWRSEEEMHQHLRSDEYRSMLLVMEMALQNPEVRFNRISGSSGLETVEKARTSTVRGKRP